MSREQKSRQSERRIGQIKALRAQGKSLREIVNATGASYQAVRKAVDPAEHKARLASDNAKRSTAKREWENANDRRTCACGRPMGVGAHRKGHTSCETCRRRRAEERMREYVALRNEQGLSNQQIADHFGVSVPAVATVLSRARRLGWKVDRDPYMERRREVTGRA